MEKKCLIIAYHFYPSGGVGAKRYNLLTNYLSKRFKILNVITIREKYCDEKDESVIHGGKIYRTGLFPRHPYHGPIIMRIINKILLRLIPVDRYSAWIIPIMLKAIKVIIKEKINTIIITGPPFSPFIAAYLLSIFFKTDLILDYQDPWVIDKDRFEPLYTKKYNWFIEKVILKKAKKIIFNTQETIDGYKELINGFDIAKKSYVIPNPYLQKENVKPRYLEKNKKVIVYAGNFYGKRRLKYIFEPLKQLFCNGELREKISIHVFGNIQDEDSQLIEKLNLSEIIYLHKRVEYSLLKPYLKGADILFLSQGDDHCYSVPYKLIDYLTIEKPILAITDFGSSTYNFMLNLDSGIVADIDKPDAIRDALEKLLIDEKEFSYKGIDRYSLENVAEDYYKILTN